MVHRVTKWVLHKKQVVNLKESKIAIEVKRKMKKSSFKSAVKRAIKHTLKRKTKKMFGRRYRNCIKAEEGSDPKVGTGKKPKGSGRRLYTDEDPSDTVSVEFSSVAAIKRTLAKKVLRLNLINVNLKL